MDWQARYVTGCFVMASRGDVRLGLLRHGRHGKVRTRWACWGEVRRVLVWYGRQGELVLGIVGSVGDWLCADGFGLAGMARNHQLQMKER